MTNEVICDKICIGQHGGSVMDENTHELKRAKIISKIKEMRLMDDNFMTAVLSDKACAELVIRIILDRDDITVKETKTQYTINCLRSHSVRLDVYAEDTNGTKYDIEIQRSDGGANPRRARYISSMIDSDTLLTGDDYSRLPESFVIFITETDVLKGNQPLYIIDRTINGTADKFNDGSHIIYVNSQIQNDTRLGKLMRDFTCVDPDKISYKVLADRAGFYKNSKEGVQTMCKIVEEIVKEEKIDAALKLLAKKVLSNKEIADILNLDESVVDELAKKTSA